MPLLKQSSPYITRGKLNRMLKYFRNKKVEIGYEYNNSLGDPVVRRISAKYDNFILTDKHSQYGSFYSITFQSKGKDIFYDEFHQGAYFTGVGRIEYCNSGPYCYFWIKFI